MNFKLKDIIVFEDDSVIALNKPPGMLSIPDREASEPSLKDLLQQQYPEIYTVHRLDKDTSGLIIFAKTASAHKHFSRQFEERKTVKNYVGLLIGSVLPAEGTIDQPIAENTTKRGTMLIHKRGKAAVTDYQVLKDFKLYSWVQFRIHTGRTHQIRVHTKFLGNPLVGDPIYGDGRTILLSSFKNKFKLNKDTLEEKPMLSRLALHAFQLKITDENNRLMELEAPLYKDMKVTIMQMEKYLKK
ncbi:RluA family pseudouridine synthase [Niabella sp. CJ426]|uniref:RluA family pseudouridine synthase n=1 Tax=Niabella sp. CJ426 TaxID=3393740 RepID=UPI003D02AAA2